MDYISKIQSNSDSVYVQYLYVLQKYSNDNKVTYGFVEGIEDISYYQSAIDPILPAEKKILINKVGDFKNKGGKDKVIQLYNLIDWKVYNKKRILFFIDRDLSAILSDTTPVDENIYITDGYSIENYIVSSYTLKRLLKEVYDLDILPDETINNIIAVFKDQRNIFCEIMSEIMANIIYWKTKNVNKPNYNNIKLDNLLYIKQMQVLKKIDGVDFVKTFYSHSNVSYDDHYNVSEINKIKEEFLDNTYHKRFTRGKFLMWFFAEFTRSVTREVFDLGYLTTDSGYKPKQVNSSTFFKDASVRCKIPQTLNHFIKTKFEKQLIKLNN